MSNKWEELTEQFAVQAEDGQQFHIEVYTTMIDASSMSNPNASPLEGLKTFRTTDGHNCNRIDDDNYEIVNLGCLKVHRI